MNVSKTERIRRDAFRHAYHIVKSAESKDKALEELAIRLTRAEVENAPVFLRDADIVEYEARVKENFCLSSLAACLGTLEGQFGFTGEQMERFGELFGEVMDTIYGGWLDWDDLLQYLQEEYGIDIKKYIDKSADRWDRIEERLEKRKDFVGEKRWYQRRSESK